MSRSRKFLIAILSVVVALLIFSALGLFYIDRIAEAVVERGATYALGVNTELGEADVDLRQNQITLRRLAVANPAGFAEPHFLTMDAGLASVEPGTLNQDVVVLPRIALSDVRLHLIRQEDTANYTVILENIRKTEEEEPEEEREEAPPEAKKKVIVREILIEDVLVTVTDPTLAEPLQTLEVPVKQIRLQNIGTADEAGVPVSEVAGIVVKAVLDTVVANAGEILPQLLAQGIREGMEPLESLEAAGVEMQAEVEQQVRSAVEEAEEQIERGQQEVEEAAEEVQREAEEQVERGTRGIEEAGEELEREAEQTLEEAERRVEEETERARERWRNIFGDDEGEAN